MARGRWIPAGSWRFWALTFIALVLMPEDGFPQLVGETGVAATPVPVVLGQEFHLQIRITTEEGWVVDAPDSIPGMRGFHPSGSVRVTRAQADEEGGAWLLSYPLVPLRPGYRPLPNLSLSLREGDGTPDPNNTQTIWVLLGGVSVESVLPPLGESVAPAPHLGPPERTGGLPALGPWALAGGLLSGVGLLLFRRRRRKNGRSRWGGSGEAAVGEEQPSLQDQLIRVLNQEAESPLDRTRAFDRWALLVRQIIESETPRSLVGLTTPELVAFLRNGPRPEPSFALEEALMASEAVRFREEPPTSEELDQLRGSLREWLGVIEQRPRKAGTGGDHV